MPAAAPGLGMQRCHSVGSLSSGVVQQRVVTRAVTPTPQPIMRQDMLQQMKTYGCFQKQWYPQSSILIGFSTINHPFWGFSPYFWKHPYVQVVPVSSWDVKRLDLKVDRMGSGVLQNPSATATPFAGFAPAPVASVVSVGSVPFGSRPQLASSFQPSTSPKNQPETKIKDSSRSTPTSKDGSPRRFYQSQISQVSQVTKPISIKSEDGSPRSPRSPRSDSPKSKPGSPRDAAKNAPGKSLSEAPWEVPYSMRARSGSISPKAPTAQGELQQPQQPQAQLRQRSESQKRRYHDLYEDHEIRQQKWQAKLEEKQRKEEEEVQKNIANTCSPRNFSRHEFQNWPEAYNDHFDHTHLQTLRMSRAY